MPYQTEVSRLTPGLFVFIVDQSGSMDESFQGAMPKAQFVSDVLNRIINDIVVRSTKGKNDVRDYYHLTLIGYGGPPHAGWGGALAEQLTVPVSQVYASPLRVETRMKKVPDGAGGLIAEQEIFPVWLEPQANGGTPMCAALTLALAHLTIWVAEHPHAYPPIVFHVTDGRSTDGDPAAIGAAIRDLATDDGHVILATVHISGHSAYPVQYPLYEDPLAGLDEHARLLRDMSSPLIASWVAPLAERTGRDLTTENACFLYNAGPEDLVWLLEIGTRQEHLR